MAEQPDLRAVREALAGHYEIEVELGSGATSTVYLARDVRHRRKVAVKVLRTPLAESVIAQRFLSEIEIVGKLAHPNILPLFDSGEARGLLYSVMPFVEGDSLQERLARDGPLPVEDAVLIAYEVADALASAHRHGIVHRDVKPGNILLSEGHALVTDFGVARAIEPAGSPRITDRGVAVGTPYYMSPEQVSGRCPIDSRSDQYSLGCVLHEMLAGQPPFPTAPCAPC